MRTEALLAVLGAPARLRGLARSGRERSRLPGLLFLLRTSRPLAFLDRLQEAPVARFWQSLARDLVHLIVVAAHLYPGAPIRVSGRSVAWTDVDGIRQVLAAGGEDRVLSRLTFCEAAYPADLPGGVVIHLDPLSDRAWEGVSALA